MILSRVRRLRFAKEEAEGRKLTYATLRGETGLSPGTLSRLLANDPIDRIDGSTLDTLCGYFKCSVGDILEHVPIPAQEVEQTEKEMSAV